MILLEIAKLMKFLNKNIASTITTKILQAPLPKQKLKLKFFGVLTWKQRPEFLAIRFIQPSFVVISARLLKVTWPRSAMLRNLITSKQLMPTLDLLNHMTSISKVIVKKA